jgi:hypothetical protein
VEEGAMNKVYAVMRARGPRWKRGVVMDEQQDWKEHADFMDRLVEEGFVLLGGPLRGTEDVLLIVRAGDEAAIHARFAEDVWTMKDLLRTKWVTEWWLRLGELG